MSAVVILCNIPLDLPIDPLATWRELAGDGQLARALEVCKASGWEALPLAAAELVRLFPGLWETEKAAERWLGTQRATRTLVQGAGSPRGRSADGTRGCAGYGGRGHSGARARRLRSPR